MSYPDLWSFDASTSTPSQNSPSLSLYPSHDDTAGRPVEHLEFYELMKNRVFQELHQCWTVTANTMVETTQTNNSLLKEIAELKAEIQRLKANEGCLLYPALRKQSGYNSITPSESVSHVNRTPSPSVVPTSSYYAGGTAVHPERFPPSILWNSLDPKNDPDVIFQPKNPSRIPMASALRHENGALIDTGLYKAIRATGTSLVENLLFPAIPKDKISQNRPRTKRLFMEIYREQWNRVVHQYEKEQPLLALCAGHWKAEHMLALILTSVENYERRQSKKSKGKGKSKARQSSCSSNSDTNIEDRQHSPMPPPSPPANLATTADSTSHVGIKRPRASSSTLVDLSGIQPLKKAKLPHANETNRRPQATTSSKPTNSLLGINGVGNASQAGDAAPPEIDVDFIIVDVAYDNLKSILSQDFPHIKVANDLLDSMKACPSFGSMAPSANMKGFLERIEKADPNDTTIDEDNKGVGWGHHQFTSGSLTCSSVMKSWEDIGNTHTARKLVAAAIRTCKIARFLCENLNLTAASSYISDTYLERVIETLWDLWKGAGAPIVTTTVRTTICQAQPSVPQKPHNTNENSNLAGSTAAAPHTVASPSEEGPLKDRLELLVREDLKRWINEYKVAVTPENKMRSKDDLVNAILDDPSCQKPSQADVDAMRAARKKGKK